MTPKSNSTEYLSGAGKSVYEGMSRADPDAVWVMQGWLFLEKFWGNEQVEALVTSVPKVSTLSPGWKDMEIFSSQL